MSLLRINLHPSPAQLRVFAAGWLVVAGAAGLASWRHGWPAGAYLAWGAGLGVGCAGFLRPATVRWLYVGLSRLTYPIGLVVSSLVLAVVYFGVLTPIGLILRLGRHDPLRRRFDPSASTYWQARPGPRDPESYFRQY